jgi:hypothetical protein
MFWRIFELTGSEAGRGLEERGATGRKELELVVLLMLSLFVCLLVLGHFER